MKKAILLLLSASFFISDTFSQQVFPSASDQQKWEYVVWNFWGGACERRIIKNGNAVPLCSGTFIEVFDCDAQEMNCHFLGYYRIQGDSVMVRQNQIFWNGTHWIDSVDCTRKEGLMYDFGREDTSALPCQLSYPGGVTNFWWKYDLMVNYEGTARKTKYMDFNPYPNFPAIVYPMRWIEGIGSNIHPFYSFSCIGDHCEQELQVTKVYRNGVLIYQDTVLGFFFPCTGWVSIEDDLISDLDSYSLTPNPAKTTLYLKHESSDQRPVNLMLFDMKGRLLKDMQNIFPQTPLDIEGLSSGLYMVKIQRGDQTKSIKFIKE